MKAKMNMRSWRLRWRLVGCFSALLIAFSVSGQRKGGSEFLRGDESIMFKWRDGYSEFPFDWQSRQRVQDAERGKYGWFDGFLWSASYKDWSDSVTHGVNLIFRGGSPYARSVRSISERVPYEMAGKPVTFAIPLHAYIGTEPYLSFSLSVTGSESETVLFHLKARGETKVIGGEMVATFHALQASGNRDGYPRTSVSGVLLVRVYPGLVNYGQRMIFEFNSLTRHMDVESGLVIGSIWRDIRPADLADLRSKMRVSESELYTIQSQHERNLDQWKQKSIALAGKFSQEGRVTVFCKGEQTALDRGELRVQAYSGNPVKDYQYGEPSPKMREMALAIKDYLGRNLELFRYQHHNFPWEVNDPGRMSNKEWGFLQEWLTAASLSSKEVMLCFQLSPFVKKYKEVTQMGTLALPADGVPQFTWDYLYQGYVTVLKQVRKICPSLRIIQMPYEFDNISNSENHLDAHYKLFQVLYKAVNTVNKELPDSVQLRVAGLGLNSPDNRDAYVEGFLKRYKADNSSGKRLDYLTWHTYIFPQGRPVMPRGKGEWLRSVLLRNNLPQEIPVIVDESGLAEPSVIEDLSDLAGAARKEAAMACFSASIQYWYQQEKYPFIPISGGGWHFALLTYGRQNAMSPYGKGVWLRSRLDGKQVPSTSFPLDENGFGLYSTATIGAGKIQLLVWGASPAIFLSDVPHVPKQKTAIEFRNLPREFADQEIKVTIVASSAGSPEVMDLLSSTKCQTLPLTRGADRYQIDFTGEEVRLLNNLPATRSVIRSKGDNLKMSLDIDEHSMYLITLEK